MNAVNIIIIMVLISGGITGAHNGFFKQSVVLIGTIICFILSWMFKNPVANFLSFNLPFFDFNGLKSLNIVMYQLIAFLLLLCLFTSVLIVLIKVTGIFEKILKFTIILGIPSKILGFIVGVIESYIIVFVVLFFLNQPAFKIEPINDSSYAKIIINSSPGLSNIVGNMNNTIKDIYKITKDYEVSKNSDDTNKQIIDTLLEHKVIDTNYLEKLEKKGKI